MTGNTNGSAETATRVVGADEYAIVATRFFESLDELEAIESTLSAQAEDWSFAQGVAIGAVRQIVEDRLRNRFPGVNSKVDSSLISEPSGDVASQSGVSSEEASAGEDYNGDKAGSNKSQEDNKSTTSREAETDIQTKKSFFQQYSESISAVAKKPTIGAVPAITIIGDTEIRVRDQKDGKNYDHPLSPGEIVVLNYLLSSIDLGLSLKTIIAALNTDPVFQLSKQEADEVRQGVIRIRQVLADYIEKDGASSATTYKIANGVAVADTRTTKSSDDSKKN